MKQRLQTLLATEKIASSKFADIVGVNRSSISHLISGRNNPSLDFLQKVLVKFPHINPDWLLLGQGAMYRNSKDSKIQSAPNPIPFEEDKPNIENIQKETKPLKPIIEENPILTKEPEEKAEYVPKKEHQVDHIVTPQAKKQVERIVFFYADGTFDTYLPNSN